jgi:ribosome-binding factor A
VRHRKNPGTPRDERPLPSLYSAARRGRAEHKTRQLCRQAYRALASAFAGEIADPLLQDLAVVNVTPAPDATRLLVELSPGSCADRSAPTPPLHEVLERLDRVRGLLRHAVATAIVRKRAPELVFRYTPTPGEGGDDHV